jgi:hypothetical protein
MLDNSELLYLVIKSNVVYLNGVVIKSKLNQSQNTYELLEPEWYKKVVRYEFDADSFELELFT